MRRRRWTRGRPGEERRRGRRRDAREDRSSEPRGRRSSSGSSRPTALDSVAELVAERKPAAARRSPAAAAPSSRGASAASAVAGERVRRVGRRREGAPRAQRRRRRRPLPARVRRHGDVASCSSTGWRCSASAARASAAARSSGLGALLLGTKSFAELVELAAAGDRRSVDLLVSDIYRRAGEIPLAGRPHRRELRQARASARRRPPRPPTSRTR